MGDDPRPVHRLGAKGTKERLNQKAPAAVDALAISPSGSIAVASGKELRVIALGATPPAEQVLAIPEAANLVAFSRTGDGWPPARPAAALRLWQINAPQAAEPVALEDVETRGKTTTFAFSSPDGRRLVSGDQDGRAPDLGPS